mmetsp:Transcript_39809/g.89171  ORF Transcript_39809/g.89171 Transcript_39809/m.89171 type:complete len:759 (+) Transcript_39809:76-2352(+)
MDADEALALFRSGLDSKDRMVALETAERLGLVAKAMGPNSARTVLLPFIEGLCAAQKHEDEVLCAFANALDADFLPSVGGPATCLSLVKILVPLCCATETAVRSRAVKSLVSLVKSVSGAGEPGFGQTEEWQALKAFLVNLSGVNLDGSEGAEEGKKEDPWFPSKLSACALYPAVYGCLPKDQKSMAEDKALLLEAFTALADDEMPMVRATAATSLGLLAESASLESFKAYLLPVFKMVSEDRSDVVRMRGVAANANFLETLPPVALSEADLKNLKDGEEGELAGGEVVGSPEAELASEATSLFLKACVDPSWRVRLSAVKGLSKALKPADAKAKGAMLEVFSDLLEDEEREVKLEATKVTSSVFVSGSSKELFELLVLPTITEAFDTMLANAGTGPEGANGPGGGGAGGPGGMNDLDPAGMAGKQELQQAQALVAMELAAFDAIPHPTLVAVVQHMFEDPSLCIKMLDKFELLAKLKESDPGALSQICMDSLSLGVHEDWRVRAAFTAKLAFIFEQIISVESSAAAAEKRAAEEGGSNSAQAAAVTPKKEPQGAPAPPPGTPLDKDAVERAWTAFKSVVAGALWDVVAEARSHFVDCLPALITWADKIGGDKYVKQLVQMLLDQYKCESGVPIPNHPDRKMSYLYKTSVLAGLQSVLTMAPAPGYFGTPSNVTELVELLLGACKDPTPNVRLVAGRAVGAYAVACVGGYGASPGAVQTVEMSLIPTLQTLTSDGDADVKYVAQVAMTQVNEAMNSAS